METGALPKCLGQFDVDCQEMMFYQYLPIKLCDSRKVIIEKRLDCFNRLIDECCLDFASSFGLKRFSNSYMYLTVKNMYQTAGCSFNRKGYHSDGFMTDDINYIWSNVNGTVFNKGKFNLTLDDTISMKEMEEQAKKENEVTYPDNSLLRLDQNVIHKVSDEEFSGMRTFVKISISKDKYDLIGNSKNYLLDYDWDMRERSQSRNIPQRTINNQP